MRGYFAIGIENLKSGVNIGTLCRTANIFGAAFIFAIGNRYKLQNSDTLCTPKHIPFYQYPDFDTFYANMPKDCMLIGVEINKKSIHIDSYQHFQRCIYLLGAEDHGLTNKAISKCHKLIQLPGNKCLNVSVAGSIVMYDRIIKEKNEIHTETK